MFLKREIRQGIYKVSASVPASGQLTRVGFWRYITEVEPNQIEITELHLPVCRLPASFAGLRLLQVSDIHMGGWMNLERLTRAIRMALSQKPDIALLTGDYLPAYGWGPKREPQLADLAAGLQPLPKACPTFSILGNHDHRTNAPAIQAVLDRIGAIDLTNSVYPLKHGQDRLYLAGVDDINAGRPRLDLVLQQLPEDGPAILLAHEPDFADASAATGRFALQISGHTHGGQVVLPYIGPPILPQNGRKYPMGLYKVGDMFQYTNRGIGMGTKSIRFHCRPEITLFVLEQEDEPVRVNVNLA